MTETLHRSHATKYNLPPELADEYGDGYEDRWLINGVGAPDSDYDPDRALDLYDTIPMAPEVTAELLYAAQADLAMTAFNASRLHDNLEP